MIKAPANKVFRAYLVDINPFCRGLVRRVLIDEFGFVFVPSYGWSNIQSSYKIKVFGEPVPMFWGLKDMDWWEKKGWANVAWAWCMLWKQSDFMACHQDSDGFIFAH